MDLWFKSAATIVVLVAGLMPCRVFAPDWGTAQTEVFTRPACVIKHEEPQDLIDLISAFRFGLTANLSDPDQVEAFKLYLATKFASHRTIYSQDFRSIAKHQAAGTYPPKEPLRAYHVYVPREIRRVLPELETFGQTLAGPAAKLRARLLDFDSQKKWWGSILGSEAAESLASQLRDIQSERGKFRVAFIAIKGEYDRAQEGGQKAKLGQTLLTLAHNVGFASPAFRSGIKSDDALTRVNAISRALSDREAFLEECGVTDSFGDFQAQISAGGGVRFPSDRVIMEPLHRIAAETMAQPTVQVEMEGWMVRPLSSVEAPFRYLLGMDCSFTYPMLALHPDFQVFTRTNRDETSEGHITVVFGTDGKGEKVAMIDKVQNVRREDLLPMLEGVRLSVAEKGYTLGLPVVIGEHFDGVTNQAETAEQLETAVAVELSSSAIITGFKPHHPRGPVKEGKSRAFRRLKLYRVLPQPGQAEHLRKDTGIDIPWSLPAIGFRTMLEQTYRLKDGDLRDKIRYLKAMTYLTPELRDPEFLDRCVHWASVLDNPESLKLWSLGALLETGNGPRIARVSLGYSSGERKSIFHNLTQRASKSSDYRGFLRQNAGYLALLGFESPERLLYFVGEDNDGKPKRIAKFFDPADNDHMVILIVQVLQYYESKLVAGFLKSEFIDGIPLFNHGRTKVNLIEQVRKRGTRFANRALMAAINHDFTVAALDLIDQGVSPNFLDRMNFDEVVLVSAVRKRNKRVVEALLTAGARPDRRLFWSDTALMLACRLGASDLVELLLKAGANPNARNWRLQNAMGITMNTAMPDDAKGEIIKLLAEAGARPPSVVDRRVDNSLHDAVQVAHSRAALRPLSNPMVVASRACRNAYYWLHDVTTDLFAR